MILVVDTQNHKQFSDVLDEISQLQYRLVGPRAKARLGGIDARGADQCYSDCPTYLVGLDRGGFVLSFAKFPNHTAPQLQAKPMMGQVNPDAPRTEVVTEAAKVTNLAVYTQDHPGLAVQICFASHRLDMGAKARRLAKTELMIAVLEYARKAGIAAITTVIDPYISRILNQFNATPTSPQPQKHQSSVTAGAAVLDFSAGKIAALRADAEILGDVLTSDAAARALLERRANPKADRFASTQLQSEIVIYCAQQLAAARTKKERAAAHRLLYHLVEKGLHPLPQKDPIAPK